MNDKTEVVTVSRLRTHCCVCQYPMSIGRSLAMRMGMNTGHVTCPKCESFLHVEQLEGDSASTERWERFVARELNHGTGRASGTQPTKPKEAE